MRLPALLLFVTLTLAANPASAQVSSSKQQTILVGHTVKLSWTASTSIIDHYNIYSSVTSGGNYALIGQSTTLTFTDLTDIAGNTYYYVVTAVDSMGLESLYSNEVSVIIPSP